MFRRAILAVLLTAIICLGGSTAISTAIRLKIDLENKRAIFGLSSSQFLITFEAVALTVQLQ
jgi:hypothetical protein